MLLTMHQRGLDIDLNKLNVENIKIGTEVILKKAKGKMVFLSDIVIAICIDDKIIGYASEVPTFLIDGCTMITKEVYDSLPDTFEGTIYSKIDKGRFHLFGVEVKI